MTSRRLGFRRPVLRFIAVVGAGVLALGLTACGDVNAGTGAVDRLETIVNAWDETVTVDSTASNNLPWSGEAAATVVVAEDTPTDRVEEMTDRIGRFLDKAEGGTAHWRYVDLQVGSFRFTVMEDATDRGQLFSAFAALRADDRVVGGFIRSSGDEFVQPSPDDAPTEDAPRILEGTNNSLRAIVADDVPLADAFTIARTAADLVDDFDDSAVVAQTADGQWAASDTDGPVGESRRTISPDTTIAFAESIRSAAALRGVLATADTLDVRLESASDVERVTDAFSEKATEIGIDLTINGGALTDDGTATAEALAVAGALDGTPGIDSVDVGTDRLFVTLSDPSVLKTAIGTILAQPGVGSLSRVGFATADGAVPGFDIEGAPDQLERLGDLAVAALAQPTLTQLIVTTVATTFELEPDPDLTSLGSVFAATRPFLVDGETLAISAARTGGFTNDVEFVVADEIDPTIGRTVGDEVAELAALVTLAWSMSS